MSRLDPSPNLEGMCVPYCPLWYAHCAQIAASYKPPGAAPLVNRMAAQIPVVSALLTHDVGSPFLAR